MKNFRLLSTKELNPVQKRRFIEWGCLFTSYDFIRIEALEFSFSTLHENLIFTSQNGVNSFFERYPMQRGWEEKKVFCVGEKTKLLLEQKGFRWVHSEENASVLAKHIATQKKGSSGFSFLCGKIRRLEIETILSVHNIPLDCIETYNTHVQSKPFGPQDGILFFSPSGVESYLEENEIGTAQCFAIGQTTASVLVPHSKHIHVAKKPSIEHLGLRVHQYLNSN